MVEQRQLGLRGSFRVTVALLACVYNIRVSLGFAPTCLRSPIREASLLLHMGLYDSPLPPRPPKKNDSRDNRSIAKPNIEEEDEDDVEDASDEMEQLFTFGKDGKEIRGLLPPLKRRLDYGVSCYFEPSDRKVLNLVDKTSCHPMDACWALESCEGDITEAWTRISMARRIKLNQSRNNQLLDDDEDYDPDDYDEEISSEYQQRKKDAAVARKKRERDDYFTPSEPDAQWLPTKNPNPVNDEPWFTG